MPKVLFYAGTAFCLFLALTSAAELVREIEGNSLAFAALHSNGVSPRAPWAILVALVAGAGVAAVFVRMAALLAARNLFGAFLALFAVSGAVASLAAVLLLQWRMVFLIRGGASTQTLAEVHIAGWFVLAYFVSLALLSLRPYFRIQASRFLSVMVIFPLPLFALVLTGELLVSASAAPLPVATPASLAFFAVCAILFFSIGVHCIRHRHLFLEMTNLRELLDGRVDPAGRTPRRGIGGVAFDS
jgi:hypothetical protein